MGGDALEQPRLPERMRAVLLTGHGGVERLEYREDIPVPPVGRDDVLIRVAAAGVNNTDVNTRLGWYSKEVRKGTTEGEPDSLPPAGGTWSGAPLAFPRIQGADCCGRIARVGEAVDPVRIGERVIVRPMMEPPGDPARLSVWTLGSECDGAFAEYVAVPATEAYRVESTWSDVELASLPCAYSTAENLLHRSDVGVGSRVLVTGASGGVGTAAVQLAKRRGAHVTGVASAEKGAAVRSLGADAIVPRGDDLVEALGRERVDVVVDVVGGSSWPGLLDVLRRGGRLVSSGAIACPVVELDLRTLYLKDLCLLGCTFQDRAVFENLIGYVERDEIVPVVACTYPLREIVRAQQDFMSKSFVGKLVLVVA